jgi:hypothetical protein
MILLEKISSSQPATNPWKAGIAASGNFCRSVYGSLTIKYELPAQRKLDAGALKSVRQVSARAPGGQAMRIYGPNGATPASSPSSARRGASSAFSLPNASETPDSRPAAAPVGVSSIDALLALQGVEDPTERRKRAVKRGREALDVLDDLKIGLLSGSLDQVTVQRLRTAASELKTNSGDDGLDSVLAEIELRVEVELAKAGSI